MKCRFAKCIDHITLSSVSKFMISYSYSVIIAKLNGHRSLLYLETVEQAAIVAHMCNGGT